MSWVAIILLCAMFVSFRNILSKTCLKHEHTMPMLLWSAVITVILSGLFFRNIETSLSGEVWGLLVLKTFLLSMTLYFLHHAMKKMDISLVEPMLNLNPVILVAFGFIFLGEKLSLAQYVGIAVIILGAYIIQVHHYHHIFEPLKLVYDKNFLLLLFVLVLSSMCQVLDKVILSKVHFQTYIFYSSLLLIIFYGMFIILRGHARTITHPIQHHYYIIIAIAVCGILADIAYFWVVALPAVPISLIIPLKRLSTLVSTIVGGNLFHERRILHKAGSCAVMMFGVYMLFL